MMLQHLLLLKSSLPSVRFAGKAWDYLRGSRALIRVARLGGFERIGLLLKEHCDSLERWNGPIMVIYLATFYLKINLFTPIRSLQKGFDVGNLRLKKLLDVYVFDFQINLWYRNIWYLRFGHIFGYFLPKWVIFSIFWGLYHKTYYGRNLRFP